jgi:hypothetical protein
MAQATAINTSPRATGVCCDQAGKAPVAESTARVTSADRERATRHICFPLAGDVLAKDSLDEGPDSKPPIQLGMISGISGWFMARKEKLSS